MVNIEVAGVTARQKLRTCKSCQSVFELLLPRQRREVLSSAYYGNVIAEAGPWSAARLLFSPPSSSSPHLPQVTPAPRARLAFCSTSPAEMSSPASLPPLAPPSKLGEDAAPTQLFSPELTYIKHKRRVYMKNAQSAGI